MIEKLTPLVQAKVSFASGIHLTGWGLLKQPDNQKEANRALTRLKGEIASYESVAAGGQSKER